VNTLGEHAVVLGASMSGLLAARALSEFYKRVTVVERDRLPDGPEQRRGVPQGRHVHGLLTAGARSLDTLFPGILDELAADGATVIHFRDRAAFWQILNGHDLGATFGGGDSDLVGYQSTRPFLEDHVRRRLRELPGVTVLDGHDVVDLAAAGGRVVGARVANRAGHGQEVLRADLVVDAMGRGARTPAFLGKLGYQPPEEECIAMRLVYTSRLFHLPPPAPVVKLFIRSPETGRTTGMAMAKLENDIWLLTVGAMVAGEPPTEWERMLEFTDPLTPPLIHDVLHRAQPTGEWSRYRYPASQWRRYDRLRRFPPGFLVFGDAMCSFNPIYAQGMSVAALEAVALRDCLREGDTALSRRFFQAAKKPVSAAWNLAAGADLALPEVPGRRTPAVRASGWYTDRLLTAASTDPAVAEQFFRVTNMVDPPTRLLTPPMLARVLRNRTGRAHSARTASSSTSATT
jgi:2-polyprenyl-6-methoxyphenol hydroxylase-like FAD-dependent oxidoreductase